MIIAGWISSAHRLEFTGMTVGELPSSRAAYQREKRDRVRPLPHDISPLAFYFWDFLEERICAGTPRLSVLKVSEFGHLLSQLSNKAIADAEELLSVGGDLGIRELKRGHLLQTLLMDGRDSE